MYQTVPVLHALGSTGPKTQTRSRLARFDTEITAFYNRSERDSYRSLGKCELDVTDDGMTKV